MRSIQIASEILRIESLLGLSVNSFIQLETITSRFILRLDTEVACSDTAEELNEQGIDGHEVRRFIKQTSNGPVPTSTVLVTCYATSLAQEIKLWYQLYRIQMFYDKPKACVNCHQYNHSFRSCRNTKICKNCAQSHSGDCPSSVLSCANCKGNHASDDKVCPVYLREIQFQKFLSEHHLTIQEARRQIFL